MEKDQGLENNQEEIMKSIFKAAGFIKQSKVVIIGTGAGMGKDSGLPDFRGNEGFWNNYPPYKGKFDFMECANPKFLKEHPTLFWGFYGHRLKMYRDKNPHQGYQILKEIAKKICPEDPSNYFAFTSNVDGHFQKAKYPVDRIFQVHGSIHYLQCQRCNIITSNDFKPVVIISQMKCTIMPYCPKCKAVQRPNILMFGDSTWLPQRTDNQELKYKEFLEKYKNQPKVLIQIGCGTVVPTIRWMMLELMEKYPNTKLIRINPDPDTAKWLVDDDRYVFLPLGGLQGIKRLNQLLK